MFFFREEAGDDDVRTFAQEWSAVRVPTVGPGAERSAAARRVRLGGTRLPQTHATVERGAVGWRISDRDGLLPGAPRVSLRLARLLILIAAIFSHPARVVSSPFLLDRVLISS